MEAHWSMQTLFALQPSAVHDGLHHLANCGVESSADNHSHTLILLVLIIPNLCIQPATKPEWYLIAV